MKRLFKLLIAVPFAILALYLIIAFIIIIWPSDLKDSAVVIESRLKRKYMIGISKIEITDMILNDKFVILSCSSKSILRVKIGTYLNGEFLYVFPLSTFVEAEYSFDSSDKLENIRVGKYLLGP